MLLPSTLRYNNLYYWKFLEAMLKCHFQKSLLHETNLGCEIIQMLCSSLPKLLTGESNEKLKLLQLLSQINSDIILVSIESIMKYFTLSTGLN